MEGEFKLWIAGMRAVLLGIPVVFHPLHWMFSLEFERKKKEKRNFQKALAHSLVC